MANANDLKIEAIYKMVSALCEQMGITVADPQSARYQAEQAAREYWKPGGAGYNMAYHGTADADPATADEQDEAEADTSNDGSAESEDGDESDEGDEGDEAKTASAQRRSSRRSR